MCLWELSSGCLVLSRKPLGGFPAKPPGECFTQALMPTTNKQLVCVELDLLCDTRSEELEVFKDRAQGFMNQIPTLII